MTLEEKTKAIQERGLKSTEGAFINDGVLKIFPLKMKANLSNMGWKPFNIASPAVAKKTTRKTTPKTKA